MTKSIVACMVIFSAVCYGQISWVKPKEEPKTQSPTTQPANVNNAVELKISTDYERALKIGEKQKQEKLLQLKKQLDSAYKANPYSHQTVVKLKQEISDLSKVKDYLPNLTSLESDSIGKLSKGIIPWSMGPVTVGTVSVYAAKQPIQKREWKFASVKIYQVIGPKDSLAYIKIKADHPLVCLHNYDHKKVDGEYIETGDTVFKVVGRKTYETVNNGTKTVYVLEPIGVN